MKKNSKNLRLKKLTISKLNGLKIYGGTDPNFTRGCPQSLVNCPSIEPNPCPPQTEQANCTQDCMSDNPDCHTKILCESVDICP